MLNLAPFENKDFMEIRTTFGEVWDQKRVESQNVGFEVSYDPRALRND